jgi:hypothetical protein
MGKFIENPRNCYSGSTPPLPAAVSLYHQKTRNRRVNESFEFTGKSTRSSLIRYDQVFFETTDFFHKYSSSERGGGGGSSV